MTAKTENVLEGVLLDLEALAADGATEKTAGKRSKPLPAWVSPIVAKINAGEKVPIAVPHWKKYGARICKDYRAANPGFRISAKSWEKDKVVVAYLLSREVD